MLNGFYISILPAHTFAIYYTTGMDLSRCLYCVLCSLVRHTWPYIIQDVYAIGILVAANWQQWRRLYVYTNTLSAFHIKPILYKIAFACFRHLNSLNSICKHFYTHIIIDTGIRTYTWSHAIGNFELFSHSRYFIFECVVSIYPVCECLCVVHPTIECDSTDSKGNWNRWWNGADGL